MSESGVTTEGLLPSFDGAVRWLNSPPLVSSELRGRVVLVQFWTFTCINWLRTAPYIRAWAQRYEPYGLTVVGVHTPEFDFERDVDNVRRAVADRAISYPVAVDSEYAVWRAFDNHYWPALYIADTDGALRHHVFGEGGYARSERIVQRLLADAGHAGWGTDLVSVHGDGAEAEADWDELRSPETYFGYARGENLASPGAVVLNQRQTYRRPATLHLNQWALDGEWTIRAEAAVANEPGAVLAFRFRARDLNLVLAPAPGAGPARYQVLLDGQPPGAAHGVDTDERGSGILDEGRMHQVIRQRGAIEDRTLEISLLDPGVEIYVVTFG